MPEFSDLDAIGDALDPIAEGLRSDGYDLKVLGLEREVLRIEILAGSEACDECLVSRELMGSIILGNLPSTIAVERVDVTYPAGYKGP